MVGSIPDPNAEKPDWWDDTQPQFIDDPSPSAPKVYINMYCMLVIFVYPPIHSLSMCIYKQSPPSDWLLDESPMMDDPNAVRPSDWDEAAKGQWKAPKISMCTWNMAPL